MNHQVYRLNLPKFDDIKNPNFTNFSNYPSKYVYLADTNFSEILKKEWINFLGFEWAEYRFFKKDNLSGSIHSDLQSEEDIKTKCAWSINWVFNGSGLIKYWNIDDVFSVGKTIGSNNDFKSGQGLMFKTSALPIKHYFLLKDCVYLVNTTLPHLAVGFRNRCVFSLRSSETNIKWENIIKKFKDYILDLD